MQAVQHVLQQIKAQPAGERHVQHVIGNYNAVVQGSGNTTVMNVNTPRQEPMTPQPEPIPKGTMC